MNERVFDFAMNGVVTGFSPSCDGLKPVTKFGMQFRHITYAVEIEGEAPLYFSIEAVDE